MEDWVKRLISIMNTLEEELPHTPENLKAHDNIQVALVEVPDEVLAQHANDHYWFR